MKQILYRAKRVDNGEWIEGFLIYVKTDPSWYYAIGEDDKNMYHINLSTLEVLTSSGQWKPINKIEIR